MKNIRALKSVYSFYFPEVQQIVSQAAEKYPQELLLKSVFPGLDNYHQNLVEMFADRNYKYQKGLWDFKYKYFANGSSEAIFHLLVDTISRKMPIYVLNGEYEGYREYAKNLGSRVIEVEDDINQIKKLPPGRWFISNPSAREGNFIDNKKIAAIGELGHEIVLDLAYLGLTPEYQMDLTHPQIVAAVASMSKPYGLFYSRIGFCFSRKPLLTLYPNIWFKNIFSIKIGEEVLQKIEPGYLYKKYLPGQLEAINILEKESGIKAKSSQVLLLAYLKTAENILSADSFRRGECYRFCLTPYFLEKINCRYKQPRRFD